MNQTDVFNPHRVLFCELLLQIRDGKGGLDGHGKLGVMGGQDVDGDGHWSVG